MRMIVLNFMQYLRGEGRERLLKLVMNYENAIEYNELLSFHERASVTSASIHSKTTHTHSRASALINLGVLFLDRSCRLTGLE
jgi:hypothetical protein